MTFDRTVVAKGSIPAGSDANKLFTIVAAPPDRCLNIEAFNWRGGDSSEYMYPYLTPADTPNDTTVNNGSGMFRLSEGNMGDGGTQTAPKSLSGYTKAFTSMPVFIIPPGWKLMIASPTTNAAAWYASCVGVVY